jgi:hypothetical protein
MVKATDDALGAFNALSLRKAPIVRGSRKAFKEEGVGESAVA